VNGYKGTNSLEALLAHIGHTAAVEVDVVRCLDGFIVAHDGLETEYGLESPFADTSEKDFLDSRYLDLLTPVDLVQAVRICDLTERKLVLNFTGNTDAYLDFLEYLILVLDPQVLAKTVVLQAHSVDELRAAQSHPCAGILGAPWKHGLSPSAEPDGFWKFISALEDVARNAFSCISVPYAALAAELDQPGLLLRIAARLPTYVHGCPGKVEDAILSSGCGVFSDLSTATAVWTQRNELDPTSVTTVYRSLLGREPESDAIVNKVCSERGLTVDEFGRRVISSPEFIRRFERELLPERLKSLAIEPSIFDSLFDSQVPAYFTEAAGVTNSRFIQYTTLADSVISQILDVLDYAAVQYFVFAGSMVGYVRDRQVPQWLDDVDVMIFEDQIDRFETGAIPLLRDTGFEVVPVREFSGGGYQIVAMQAGPTRRSGVWFSEGSTVEIPWAQVDVFYSTVDGKNQIRNLGGWGLYHHMDVPFSWVNPGVRVPIHGGFRPVFSQFERDVLREYGDVHRNIVIASHDPESARLTFSGLPWLEIRDAFEERYRGGAINVPPSISPRFLASFAPAPGVVETDAGCHSLDAICSKVIATRTETLVITQGDNLFWARDLKRLFPSVRLVGRPSALSHVPRATLMSNFFVEISSDAPSIQETICANLETMRVIRDGRDTPNPAGTVVSD